MMAKAEKRMIYFIMNNKATMGNIDDGSLDSEQFVFFDCKQEAYL